MPTLKPFQIEDLARAALQDGAIIAWEPGMGKSLASIAWPLVKKAKRTLIVAPGSLHYQMMVSAAKFFKISLRQIKNKEDFFNFNLDSPPPSNAPPLFYIVSYQTLGLNEADEWHDAFGRERMPKPNKLLVKRRKLWCKQHRVKYDSEAGESIGITRGGIKCVWTPTIARLAQTYGSFDCVVVDEGTRLQSTESRIGSSVRTLEPRYRLVLTGTPIKNRLESIFWLCAWATGHTGRWPYESTDAARERFANTFLQKERFLTKEAIAAQKGAARSITKRSARICSIHRLWKTLAPVIIRRRKADCGEQIPQKTVTPILVKPGTAQLAVYQYHLQNAPVAGKKAGSKAVHPRTQVGMQITNLRLAALCPNAENLGTTKTGTKGTKRSWTEWTPKLFTTLQIIRECLSSGKQVIVGSPFREFSQTLQSKLEEAEVASVLLDGDTSPEQRGLLADEFKQGKQAVLIAGIKSMGEGHSFENCAHLILPGLSFAYDENEQFIHRVWRLTSPGPVNIYPIITEGSIDQNLHEIFTEKGDASNLAIDGRLFSEPESNIDMEWLLKEARRVFNPEMQTDDEEIIMAQWDSTLARQLRHSYQQYMEHMAAEATPSSEDMDAAMHALSIASPTQLTIDICRKHNKTGTKSISIDQINKTVEKINKRNKK